MWRRGEVVFLLLVLSCVGLIVQPETITVPGGPGTAFDQVFTVTNDESTPRIIDITPHQYSMYLADDATLSTEKLTLRPQESKNVQVRGTVPLLGPETHRLRYDFLGPEPLGSFRIDMPIDGTPKLHPKLDLAVPDVVQDEPVTATATLFNFGNINAYYDLTMHIKQLGTTIGTITYPQAVQVLPGAEEEIVLLYTERLEPGEYFVELTGMVNDEVDVVASQPFRVLLEDQQRTIPLGDDLLITISGTGDSATFEYVVQQDGTDVLRDTFITKQDVVTIPTATLPAGTYDVTFTVTHSRGTDVTNLQLIIKEQRVFSWWMLLAVIIVGAAIIPFTTTARLHLRILRTTWRVKQAEKQLNTLIRRAHRIA